jgi:hypothetical protein
MGLLRSCLFSDEATFHVCGKVNRHTVRICGTENVDAGAGTASVV